MQVLKIGRKKPVGGLYMSTFLADIYQVGLIEFSTFFCLFFFSVHFEGLFWGTCLDLYLFYTNLSHRPSAVTAYLCTAGGKEGIIGLV